MFVKAVYYIFTADSHLVAVPGHRKSFENEIGNLEKNVDYDQNASLDNEHVILKCLWS